MMLLLLLISHLLVIKKKKKDMKMVENFRGVSFINVITKLFMGILLGEEGLWNWVNAKKLLNDFQSGFGPDYSTANHIFSLFGIV